MFLGGLSLSRGTFTPRPGHVSWFKWRRQLKNVKELQKHRTKGKLNIKHDRKQKEHNISTPRVKGNTPEPFKQHTVTIAASSIVSARKERHRGKYWAASFPWAKARTSQKGSTLPYNSNGKLSALFSFVWKSSAFFSFTYFF